MGQLPPDFPAAIGVVLHLAADAPSLLPGILSRSGPLPAQHPSGREELRAGRVYVAPPDHHLHIDGDHIEATKGPPENRHRPSIDALFRSAAYTRSSDVVGVVLTGLLGDGTSGLWTIQQRGGVTVVQDPLDAEFDSMPRSALAHLTVDHVVPLRDLGALLDRLVREARPAKEVKPMEEEELRRLKVETEIARNERAFHRGVLELGQATYLTCPECHGSLVEIREGRILRYRCHTGHAYSADSLLGDITKDNENQAYQLLRSLEEAEIMLRRLARHYQEVGDERSGQRFLDQVDELEDRIQQVTELALRNRRMSETSILQDEGDNPR